MWVTEENQYSATQTCSNVASQVAPLNISSHAPSHQPTQEGQTIRARAVSREQSEIQCVNYYTGVFIIKVALSKAWGVAFTFRTEGEGAAL